MKNAQDVRSRIFFLLGEELERRVQEATERLPHRCTHNHRQALDSRKQLEGAPNEGFNLVNRDRVHLPMVQTMGLCMLGAETPEQWQGNICDEPIDAKRCPYFTPTQDREALLREFQEDLQDGNWIQANLPEVHGLLWVADMMEIPTLPWWKRLWFFFRPMKIEPVYPAFDPIPLLQELEKTKEALCALSGTAFSLRNATVREWRTLVG